MTSERYPAADRIVNERYAAILAENERLTAEIAHMGRRLIKTQATVSALELLPPELHADYLRRKELGGGA